MKRSLELLTSGIPGFNWFSSSQSSSGRESKKVKKSSTERSALKTRIINRATEALMGVDGLGKAQRNLIIGLITQALATTTDERLLEMMETACVEFDAILLEFSSE